MNMKALPVRAGLNTFDPIPPKSPFATTIAMSEPRMTIHRGVVDGITRARRIPDTTAERFDIRILSFVIIWNIASNATHDATAARILISAGIPKK